MGVAKEKSTARTVVTRPSATKQILKLQGAPPCRASGPPRIIYNDDTCTLRTAPPPHTVDSINMALDYLKGTQVDCLCWCVGEQIAYAWPSKVIENIFELKERGGEDVLHLGERPRRHVLALEAGP